MTGTATDTALATELYRLVALTRAIELRLQQHITERGFGGFWHPGLGQDQAARSGRVSGRADHMNVSAGDGDSLPVVEPPVPDQVVE